MAGQSGILEVLEALLLALEEVQDFRKAAQVNEGGGLAQEEVQEATVTFLGSQPFDMREGLLQDSDSFGMGMPSGCLLRGPRQLFDGLVGLLAL